jgi:hypothetical protein
MPNFRDLSGLRFGRWTVLSIADKQGRHTAWNCRCECGKEKVCLGINLVSGKSKSCGCMREFNSLKHGHRKHDGTSREYETWCGIISRCESETDTNYHNYGARGIKVCDRWRNSFDNFLLDMGKRPSPKHSIDRIDVNGNYEPSNCRWATKEIQMQNRRMLKNNTTGVSGVYLSKEGKYKAQINAYGKRIYLGTFDTLEEAKATRQKAEEKFWKTS